jgi:beta-lactamase regulating signal transducer with metallopeptidase domain
MTTLASWVSPSVVRALGWALLHFLWQGTALAGLAGASIALCRRASTRYAVALSGLVLMLAAPVLTLLLYRTSSSSNPTPESAPPPMAATLEKTVPATATSSQPAVPIDALPWLVEAWLAGVAIFSLRMAGGFLLVERMRRTQSVPVGDRLRETCLALQRRLGLVRGIQYCECAWLEAPAVIGWFRPIVLVPISALTGLSDQQLQVVIAHELAHIRRLDPFVNVFQIAAEMLLFYHPAVWWLNKRIRAERENCCDDTAISLCGNAVEYARALSLMEEWRGAPALAMAANRGPVGNRIARLLGRRALGTETRGTGLTASCLCLTLALVAGNALLGFAHAGSSARSTASVQAPQAPVSPVRPAPAQPASKSIPAAKPTPARPPSGDHEPLSPGSYIDGMKAAGLGDLTFDQLVALKIQGVTPEYVRAIREQGLHPDADGIIGMRVQGVTPDYIRELRATGLALTEEDEIVGMKVQGVTPEYVRGLKELGIQPDADQIIGMKVQGVTPQYIRDLRAAGLHIDADEVVGMRVQGVTPEYIRDIRATGLSPTADQIIGMRVQGVTPEYVKALQSAGFKLDVDEVIGAKVQGLTPEFIERARKHGFQNLDLDKLIQLKHLGVLDAPAEL